MNRLIVCQTGGRIQNCPVAQALDVVGEKWSLLVLRPRFEYFLTDKGQTLGPVLKALHKWGRAMDEGIKRAEIIAAVWYFVTGI